MVLLLAVGSLGGRRRRAGEAWVLLVRVEARAKVEAVELIAGRETIEGFL